MHHIFIKKNQIVCDNIFIDKNSDFENFNHLYNSLRIDINENILISLLDDAIDCDYKCKIKKITKEEIIIQILEIVSNNELKTKINLYQGIVKYDKFEYIIEKSVELGVFSITPVVMDNCIFKFKNEKIDKKIDRYNKISKSASEQSKRSIIPKVNNPINFLEMINMIKDNYNNFLFYENSKDFNKTKENIEKIKNINKDFVNIIIGPEGGFSEKEIELSKNFNVKILTLGKRILRTETASIVALSFLLYNLE